MALLFFQKVFDSYLAGTSNVYTNTEISQLLGSADHIDVAFQAKGISGTSPTLTIQLENSFDGTRWQNRNPSGTPELNASGLIAGDNALVTFTDVSAVPLCLDRLRLRIALGGTNPTGVIRIWVGGRSPLVY